MQRDEIFNVRLHRANANYKRSDLLRRLLWGLLRPLVHWSPRMAYGFRVAVLRAFGARIGKRVRIYPSVQIFFPWNIELGDEVTIGDGVKLYSLGMIRIGEGCMISYGAHLCAGSHDYHYVNLPLVKAVIELGQGSWVGTEAYIGPGVRIGDFSIVGARAAIHKSFDAFAIIGGNPAKLIRTRPVPATTQPYAGSIESTRPKERHG